MHKYGLGLTVWMWLAAAVGVVAGVRVAGDFALPDAAERRRAIGSVEDLPPLLRRALEPDDHFQPIDSPGPHDWLANHRERGQTFAQFVAAKPNRPDKRRRTIYLLPLGAFDPERSPPLDQLQQFTEAYFMMPVKRLPAVQLRSGRITERINEHTRNRQLLTGDVLKLLKKRLPKDAYCLLGITMEDLYPDESWNFVFGQAMLRGRVGVYSFARYDPQFYKQKRPDDWRVLMLKRSCNVLAHEAGHMFGAAHCIHFNCQMNGSNNLAESDAHPMHLCPVCLRKLHHSIGFDVVKRYQRLHTFCRRAGFTAEADWYKARLYRIAPDLEFEADPPTNL